MAAVQWSLCGTQVCWSNFLWLMSLGSLTVRKMLKGVPDGRTFSKQAPIGNKAQSVDFFFCELYHSAAEPLPCDEQRLQGIKTQTKGKPVSQDADVWFEDSPWLNAGEDPNGKDDDATAMSATSATSAARQEWNPDAPSVDVLLGFTIASSETVVGMPRRYLSHCHLHDLYWMFEASWDCLRARSVSVNLAECPSFSLFRQRWRIWRRYLKIRKPSQHAQCQTCWELQRVMNAKDAIWSKRAQAAKDLREHYQLQYMDRCIYWSMRWASRFLGSVLCVIIDSMDKTKMSYPRWPFDKNPKALDKLIRPRFVFTLAIAHGWCTAAYVQDEVQHHGSSAFCEALVRVVEHVYVTSRTSKRAFPQHLVIQSDNTVAQAKNQHAFLTLAFFVAKYRFLTVNLFFLMVGHTHEDVDQMFGVVLSLVLQRHKFQTPEEFLVLLRQELSERCLAQGHQLITETLTAIRDFKDWMRPMDIKLEDAFKTRGGVETPHAFTFKMRRDLCWADVNNVARPGVLLPGHPNDVMCCVKTYMRDQQLQDIPTLVIPFGHELRVRSPSPLQIKRCHELTEKQIDQYLALACLCEEEFDLPQAAARLRKLVVERVYEIPDASWLEGAEVDRPRSLELGHSIFPHLPAASWRLTSKIG
jgi:hypothetical protein